MSISVEDARADSTDLLEAEDDGVERRLRWDRRVAWGAGGVHADATPLLVAEKECNARPAMGIPAMRSGFPVFILFGLLLLSLNI